MMVVCLAGIGGFILGILGVVFGFVALSNRQILEASAEEHQKKINALEMAVDEQASEIKHLRERLNELSRIAFTTRNIGALRISHNFSAEDD